jgi:hypothetical protein
VYFSARAVLTKYRRLGGLIEFYILVELKNQIVVWISFCEASLSGL